MKSHLRMFTFLGIAVFAATVGISEAQQPANLPVDLSNPEFTRQFIDLDFDGKFALLATSDEKNNYYLVDLTQLPAKFERVWFMNLIFRSDRIVNIDPRIGNDRLWFLSNRKYKEQEVLDEFMELKAKTKEASAGMTDPEKSEWMKTHDKYK